MKRKSWVEPRSDCGLSISQQCRLLGLARSSFYYQPVPETELNLELMRKIDELYLQYPFYGRPNYTRELQNKGYKVNHKRVGRLMKKMGIKAMVPGPHTSKAKREYKTYPYLLKDLKINRCNQVWASDITYIPVCGGFLYLTVILDWYSRYILSWRLSNNMESDFCVEALEEALSTGAKPEIFNTDQGVQYTSHDFTGVLQKNSIQISMDGKGHYWDNIIVERLWRTIKYEEVYLKNYETSVMAYEGLDWYIPWYNNQRRHSALDNLTPKRFYNEAA